jgi:hypothetical protein
MAWKNRLFLRPQHQVNLFTTWTELWRVNKQTLSENFKRGGIGRYLSKIKGEDEMDEQARKERKNAYMRAWYLKNREKNLAYKKKAYLEKNREKIKAYQRAYYLKNSELVKAHNQKNREKINAYQRAYYRKRKTLKSNEEA